MPRNLKTHFPANENTSSTPAAIQQASPAMWARCCGVSVGVMARNAGMTAMGSIITNSELKANKVYSIRPISAQSTCAGWRRSFAVHARRKYRLGHTVNNLFVRRTNRCQNATKISSRGFSFTADEIIRTKPDTPFHRYDLRAFKIEPLRIDQARLMEPLKHIGRILEAGQRLFDCCGPFRVGQVTAQENPTCAPGVRRKARYFKNQIPFFVRERFEL